MLRYICWQCRRKFKTKLELKKHQKSRHGHRCPHCVKRFRSKEKLEKHQLKEHIITCPECQLGFPNNATVSEHMQYIHGKVMCKVCGEIFTSFYKLEEHFTDTHIIDDKLKCSICDNIFLSQADLANHELFEHVDNANLPNISLLHTAFKDCIAAYRLYYDKVHDVDIFFNKANDLLTSKLTEHLNQLKNLKFFFSLRVTMHKVELFSGRLIEIRPTFNSTPAKLFDASSISDIIASGRTKINSKIEDFQAQGSGFHLAQILYLDLHISGIKLLAGGCNDITIPKWLLNKHAIRSPIVQNQKCFIWAIAIGLHPLDVNLPRRKSITKSIEHCFDFDSTCLTFPVSVDNIALFEEINNINVDLYGLDLPSENKEYYVIKHTPNHQRKRSVSLLLLQDGDKSHYVTIMSMTRLRNSKTPKRYSKYFCSLCLQGFKNGELFLNHAKTCSEQSSVSKTILPTRGTEKEFLQFNKFGNRTPIDFVIYADFECTLLKYYGPKRSDTTPGTDYVHKHVPNSYCMYVASRLDNITFRQKTYVGTDCIDHFLKKLRKMTLLISEYYKENEPMSSDAPVSCESNTCHICKKTNNPEDMVRNHHHITGAFLGWACNACNLNYKPRAFIPVVFHFGAKYDTHLFIPFLQKFATNIKVIPANMQQYHSLMFSWICPLCDENYCTHYKSIKVIDSFKFLSASLEELSGNLKRAGSVEELESRFSHTFTWIQDKFGNQARTIFNIAIKKGVYPYEFIDNINKLDMLTLPSKSDFFSTLHGHITDEDYARAEVVWKALKCKKFKDYHKFYIQTDVMLLADIFENFRTISLKEFNLDPAHYISLPAFAFDAMLEFTGAKPQLITDSNMYTFFEESMRGGVAQISNRYAKANNLKCPDFDSTKDTSYIMYMDANALYSSAMTEPLPYTDFIWITKEEIQELEVRLKQGDTDALLTNENNYGYLLEVDLLYPTNLHISHNDLPLAPEHIQITDDMLSPYNVALKTKFDLPNNKIKKLIPHLGPRQFYKVYLSTLILYQQLGLIVTKIHRGVRFVQLPWIRPFMNHVISKRQAATNDFEMCFYKFVSNSIFGKSIEDVRKRISIHMVTNATKAKDLISSRWYIEHKVYNENLAAIHLKQKLIRLDKPIFIGTCVLDIAKRLLYDFYYNNLKSLYGNQIKLVMTDTDSVLVHITTENVYKDMLEYMEEKLDLSNYDAEHPIFTMTNDRTKTLLRETNKKALFCWKDEAGGKCISEVVALKAKMYSFLTENDTKSYKRAKGINKTGLKNITFDDYKSALMEDTYKLINVSNIQSTDHTLRTTHQIRKGVNPFDDKRYVLNNKIATLAYNHFSLRDDLKRRYQEDEAEALSRKKIMTVKLKPPNNYCANCDHCMQLVYTNKFLQKKT